MRKFLFLLSLAPLLLTTPGAARTEETITYTKKQSYDAALRYLRVDRGYSIIEKDIESGYLLFEYPTGGSSAVSQGSIEVIQRGKIVALVIQLPKMPVYHERLLATDLLKKLRADYGDAPKAEAPEPKKPEDSKDEPPAKEKTPVAPPDKPVP